MSVFPPSLELTGSMWFTVKDLYSSLPKLYLKEWWPWLPSYDKMGSSPIMVTYLLFLPKY